MIYEPVDFVGLERVNTRYGRLYKTPDNQILPSVTTVLSYHKKDFIIEWRKRVGEKEANRISREASFIGTTMHNYIEKTIKNEIVKENNSPYAVLGRKMGQRILEQLKKHAKLIIGLEVPVYYPNLYAGTADIIAIDDDGIFVGDFKSTRIMKTEEQIENYKIQVVAYGEALNCLYDLDVKRGIVFMADRNIDTRNFLVEGEEWRRIWIKWLDILSRYIENTHGRRRETMT